MGRRQLGSPSWDDGDDTTNLSILSDDGEPGWVSARSTVVRLAHSHAAVERWADTTARMAWLPAPGYTAWSPAWSNANEAPSPAGPLTWGNGLIALDMPASSGGRALQSTPRTGMSVPQEFLIAPASNSRALFVSKQAPLAFDPASGWLAIWGQGGGERIGETITPGGFLEVTLRSQIHSSDPSSPRFDPALAGANRETLTDIRLEAGSAQVPLALASQTLTRGLTVQTDGPVDVTGTVLAQGSVAIGAETIAVYGRLQAATVDLASAGVMNVATKGSSRPTVGQRICWKDGPAPCWEHW